MVKVVKVVKGGEYDKGEILLSTLSTLTTLTTLPLTIKTESRPQEYYSSYTKKSMITKCLQAL